jgi:hypothetical protein
VKLLLTRKLRIPVAALRAKARLRQRSERTFPAGMMNKDFNAVHKEYSFVSPADNAGFQIDLLPIG